MQFELAANTLVGDSFSKGTEAELASGKQAAPRGTLRVKRSRELRGTRGEGTRRKRTGNGPASTMTSSAGSDDGCEGRQASAEPDAW